jgi:hypothetical protein
MAHLFKSDLYPCYDLPKHLSTRKERESERKIMEERERQGKWREGEKELKIMDER